MGLRSRSEDCCCCFGLRAGTLILLYLELFSYGGLSLINLASFQSEKTIVEPVNDYDGRVYYAASKEENSFSPPVFIGCLIMLVIVIAGLFSIGKKKPSLLIPYLIIRILYATIVVLVMLVLLFTEKWGLDALSKPKSYNSVLEDLTGQENLFGKALNITTDVLYFLVVVEVLLIVLEIHFAKVVYACYKQLEEQSNIRGGIVYSSPSAPVSPACNVPYTILSNQYYPLSNQPGHQC